MVAEAPPRSPLFPPSAFAYFALACAGVIGALAFGLRMSFGLFLGDISEETASGNRQMFSMATAIQSILWGFSTPVIGAFTDRSGPLLGITCGALCFAAGLFLSGVATSTLEFFAATGLLVGVACGATSFGVLFGAVGKLFPDPRSRTKALGITTSLSSLGQFAVPPLSRALLDAHGWRNAFKLLSLLALAIIPLTLPLARAEKSERVRQNEQESKSLRQTLRDAAGYNSYRLLVVGFFVCGLQILFVATHLPAYCEDSGLGTDIGAWSVSVIGVANVLGSYTFAHLGASFPKHKANLLSLIYVGRALAMLLFISFRATKLSVVVFAFVTGFLWLGTVPLTQSLVLDMFGSTFGASLFGIAFASHQVGSFFGSWLGGLIYDSTGEYTLMWWINIGFGVLAGFVHQPISDRPFAELRDSKQSSATPYTETTAEAATTNPAPAPTVAP